jgi:cytochrome c peroxidase
MRIFIAILLCLPLFAGESLLEPLPESVAIDHQKALLGKALFFDTKLSADDTVSCATCHNLEDGGDDNLPVSFGIKGKRGNINAPTVLNAGFNFRQFWDGRAKDLQEQAEGPIVNPVEMGNSFEHLIETLKKSPYAPRFQALYEDGVTKENITDAIAEFEKALVTPSPYDDYLRGDSEALTPSQKEGLELFKEKGCVVCHHGVNMGGTMYSKFGVVVSSDSINTGRYNVTKNPLDTYYFKVPTLRNVALTAPYFHDGRAESLEEAVAIMSNVQLGRAMEKEEIDKIVEFLQSLTGRLPAIARP